MLRSDSMHLFQFLGDFNVKANHVGDTHVNSSAYAYEYGAKYLSS